MKKYALLLSSSITLNLRPFFFFLSSLFHYFCVCVLVNYNYNMPKAKTSSRVSSISKLSPFFRKRTDKPKLELHDYILASDTTSTSYPTFWADPEVLSQTNAYRIRRIGKLPSTLENVINMCMFFHFFLILSCNKLDLL